MNTPTRSDCSDAVVQGNPWNPQCAAIATNLQTLSTLQAVADAKSGQVVPQNPTPGTRGNVGLNSLEYAGTWRVDMALSEEVPNSGESARNGPDGCEKRVQPSAAWCVWGRIRLVPLVGGSILNINSTDPFGLVPTKGASIPNSPDFPDARQFELKIRLDF